MSTRAVTNLLSATNASTDNRNPSGIGPRSVQVTGNVTVTRPPTPPAHTTTSAPPRRFVNNTGRHCPNNGWNGCVTTREPKSGLDDGALYRDRGYPEDSRPAAVRLGYAHRPDRPAEVASRR